MLRTILWSLLTILSLVAPQSSQHAPVPPQLLSQDIIGNYGTIMINQYVRLSPLLDQGAPKSFPGPRLGDLLAFVAFVLCARKLWHQSQTKEGHHSARRALHFPGRNHTVFTSEASVESDQPVLPLDDVTGIPGGGHPRSPNHRGRNSAASAAPTKYSSPVGLNVLHDHAEQVNEKECGSANASNLINAKDPAESELPPSQDPTAHDKKPPSSHEQPVNPPNVLTKAYRTYWIPAASKVKTVPIPKGLRGANSSRPRYSSLPSTNVYQGRSPDATKSTPLQSTLYTGSASLSTTWFFLFVAVNYGEVVDPENDLPFFRDLLIHPDEQSLDIRFESLSGPKATILSITEKLAAIYLKATRNPGDSRVVVLLSGSGNDNNEMHLSNNEVVTEKILRNSLVKAHMESNITDAKPALFVFDICRPNPGKLSTLGCHVVNMIWSCSPGQRGYGVGLEDLPSSVFLLALCWTASEIPQHGHSSSNESFNFEQVFRHRVRELNTLILTCHNYWHYVEPSCRQCEGPGGQRCDPPEPQAPEGEEAGWDTLADLAALIMNRCPERVHGIVNTLKDTIKKCSRWEKHDTVSVKRNSRGATMPTFQG